MTTITKERKAELARIQELNARFIRIGKDLGFVAIVPTEPDMYLARVQFQVGAGVIQFASGVYDMGNERWKRVQVSGFRQRGLKHEYVELYDPAQNGGRLNDPRITLSLEKNDEQIANAVRARLLPQYETIIEAVAVKVAEANAYETLTLTNLKKLMQTEPSEHEARSKEFSIKAEAGEETKYFGWARVAGDSVRLDLSGVTVDQARRVLAILRETPQDNALTRVEVVSVRKMEGAGNLKAFVDIRVGGSLVITQCSIIDGKRGLFVSMPRQLARDGRWRDVVIASDEDVMELYRDAILKAYYEEDGTAQA